jgi:hypothetical protein
MCMWMDCGEADLLRLEVRGSRQLKNSPGAGSCGVNIRNIPQSKPTPSEGVVKAMQSGVVKAMQSGFVRCATKYQCSRNSDSLECECEAELIQILTFSAFQSPGRAGVFRISSIPNLYWKP